MCCSRQRVLPYQVFLRYFGAKVTRLGAHVAVGELEPSAGKGFGESLRVFVKAFGDGSELGVKAHRQIGGQHGRLVHLAGHMRVGNDLRGVLSHPLFGTCRRVGQLPLVLEEVLKVVVAPLRRGRRPSDFQAAGDRVFAMAGAKVAAPAQALGLQTSALGLRACVGLWCCAVRFAKGVATGDQGHDFFVIHGHAIEGGADVFGCGHVVAAGVGPFRVHIDQTHVSGGQVFIQIALALVAVKRRAIRAAETLVSRQPLGLFTPVHVQVGFPYISAATGKAKGPKAHGFQRNIARQNEQVGP